MTGKLSPQEFVSKWREVTLKERSAAQSHFNDVCHLGGHLTLVGEGRMGEWEDGRGGDWEDRSG